jgi:glycosyltransferase involved in cell wall biosynthesis
VSSSPYREPKGLYLLEAMAAGVPVVAPNHGALPDLIEATGGGVLAASAEPGAVADALWELWQAPAHAAELGRLGRERVCADFTVSRMAERVEAVYQAAIDGQPAAIGSGPQADQR